MACSSSQDPYQQTSAALGEQVIYQAHQQWQASNQQLASSAQAFCQAEQSLEQTRADFLQAQHAWAALQPLLIGPLNEGNRAWQVQFWPDKKNLVARQVKQFLKANPEHTLADVQSGSVVVQGLSAYEYLLFDQDVDFTEASHKQRYCPLLQQIAVNQQQLADDVISQWQGNEGMLAQLTEFPNQRYAEPLEALTAILQAQVISLDGLKKKLGTPLGRSEKDSVQPHQAQSWRSQASLNNLSAELSSALALWQGVDQHALRSLLGAEHADLIKQIDAAYLQAQNELAAFKQPLTVLLGDEQQRQALFKLYESFDRVHRLHEDELTLALGVQLGFNANDGD
ncbi:imelysin [Pseudomonas sp. C27(2019)]|uniref:imelysin family protein n=1 Tax=Pseudomonas sp. C27(2019) TaxID=2604941 RepID=UPI0012455F9E|nr:imelysin family protein [Pseudomonas sp. C27(2019)]QEY60431.1 imelysin [Pseudomonas sp. C27(2019)]